MRQGTRPCPTFIVSMSPRSQGPPEIMPYDKLRMPYVTITFVPYAISCIFFKGMSYDTNIGGWVAAHYAARDKTLPYGFCFSSRMQARMSGLGGKNCRAGIQENLVICPWNCLSSWVVNWLISLENSTTRQFNYSTKRQPISCCPSWIALAHALLYIEEEYRTTDDRWQMTND